MHPLHSERNTFRLPGCISVQLAMRRRAGRFLPLIACLLVAAVSPPEGRCREPFAHFGHFRQRPRRSSSHRELGLSAMGESSAVAPPRAFRELRWPPKEQMLTELLWPGPEKQQQRSQPQQQRPQQRPQQRRRQEEHRYPGQHQQAPPAREPTPGRRTGKVSRWLNLKGIGWIKPDDGGETIFVHFSAISPLAKTEPEQSSLLVGDHVEFDVEPDRNDPERVLASDVTGIGRGFVQPGYQSGEKVGWGDEGPIREVYVGNLAFRTTWKDLQKHFAQVGDVSWAGVATDGWDEKNNHPFSKGWGTVRFDDADEARRAISELSGSTLHGRQIYVKEYFGGQQNDEDDEFAPILPWT